MRKRSNIKVMASLIGLVKPLTGYMILAILMGIIGHLCASFITIFGGYALLDVLGFSVPFSSLFAFPFFVIWHTRDTLLIAAVNIYTIACFINIVNCQNFLFSLTFCHTLYQFYFDILSYLPIFFVSVVFFQIMFK